MGAVFRAIPSNAQTLEQLRMPEAVRNLAKVSNGLILVTGKTGSGKSTTLAAMIDDINSRIKGHILTIEDPIEFVHPRKSCLISQREIGAHAQSFSSALLSALREDPDVILVGELRDLETISTAITAAEMGILVMATLHTNGAAATVDRIVNAFPADKQNHVRTMLSTSLRGVVSQQLITRKGSPGRVAALEVLINTPAAANLIRQGKIDQLESTMQSGAAAGMRTMDSAIEQLLEQGMVSGRSAFEKSINKAKFEAAPRAGLMARRILVTSALPYANGPTHLGHMTETIQCDIWVRAMRLMGHDVVYVCADDTHGTPIMLKAEAEGVTPEQLIEHVGAERRADFAAFGIGFDNYYTTHSEENRRLTVRMYEALVKAGHITRRSVRQAYDEKAGMFLPDRYVKGTCPRCRTPDQYGDSCENCGATYSTSDLIDPRFGRLRHASGRARVGAHLLPARRFRADAARVDPLGHAADGGRQQAGRVVRRGPARLGRVARRALLRLRDPGRAGQVLLRLARRAGRLHGELRQPLRAPGPRFDDYWAPGSDAELHHFIGKDILYFHSLFWPATLEGAGFRKPTAVHAHGFLTVNGEKMSKSRGTFVTARRYLDRLPPEYFRYFLAAKLGPGLEDIDMNLEEFATRINAELVGKLVNIASRCASFIHRGHGGRLAAALPDPALYREFADAGAGIMEAWETLEYAAAVRETMALADQANLYIDRQKPWLAAKDPARAAEVQAVCTQGINLFRVLMTYLKPVLPKTAEQAEAFLGAPVTHWRDVEKPLVGTVINEYRPLVTRVDATAVQDLVETPMTPTESATLQVNPSARRRRGRPAQITPDDFAKVDLRIARVEAAEFVDGADRLLKLGVDLGGERRTIFAGIRGAYEPAALVGRHIVVVANLKPKKMRFGTSEGMALAASDDAGLFLLSPDSGARAGMKVS